MASSRSPALVSASSVSTNTRAPANAAGSASFMCRREAADQVEVRAGSEPFAVDQGRGGQRGAAHDVGRADRRFEIFRPHAHPSPLAAIRRPGPARRRGGGSTPRRGPGRARSHGRRAAGARPCRCRAPAASTHPGARGTRRPSADAAAVRRARDLVAVHVRQRHARVRVVEHIGRVQAGQAARAVAREDVDRLDAEEARIAPGRHDQHGAAVGARSRPCAHGAAAPSRCAREGIAQGGHEPVEIQVSAGLVGVEVSHWVGFRSVRGQYSPANRRSLSS